MSAPSGNNPSGAIQTVSKWDLAERRSNVHKFKLRGMSVRAIAKLLNISEKTVYRDLEMIREENVKVVDQTTVNEYMADALARYQEIEERAWSEYHSAEDGTTQRIKALDLLRVVANDRIKALKDTGFIKTQAEAKIEVEHTHRLAEIWTPEMQDQVARALLDESLTPQLAEPVPEDEILEAELVDSEDETALVSATNKEGS